MLTGYIHFCSNVPVLQPVFRDQNPYIEIFHESFPLPSLNANCLLLAIDDPVQTIDDLNLWGLIETLRHDFNQHFLLLSTHEQDYSQLLTNKLIKWGIETINVDMEKARK